jgi:hypothetical protein
MKLTARRRVNFFVSRYAKLYRILIVLKICLRYYAQLEYHRHSRER